MIDTTTTTSAQALDAQVYKYSSLVARFELLTRVDNGLQSRRADDCKERGYVVDKAAECPHLEMIAKEEQRKVRDYSFKTKSDKVLVGDTLLSFQLQQQIKVSTKIRYLTYLTLPYALPRQA